MTLRKLHAQVRNLSRKLISWFQNYYNRNDLQISETKNHFENAVEILRVIFEELYEFAYLDQFACNILKNIAVLLESVVNQNLEYFLFNTRE